MVEQAKPIDNPNESVLEDDFDYETRSLDGLRGDQEEDQHIVLHDAPPVSFFRIFSYATKIDYIYMSLGLLGSLITGLTTPANTLIYGNVLNGMVTEIALIYQNRIIKGRKTSGEFDNLLNYGKVFAIQSCVLGLLMMVATYVSVMLFNVAAQNQIFRIRNIYLQSVLNKDIEWFDVNHCGEFASRMNDDLNKYEDGLGEKASMLVHFLVAFVGSMAMALYKGWKMTLMCLPALPIAFVVIGIAAYLTAILSKKEMESYAKAGAIAEEVFSALRTVVAFGGERKESARYAVHLAKAREYNIKKSFCAGVGFGGLWLFVYCTYAWSFWYGVELVLEERPLPEDETTYTPGTMFTVFMSILMAGVSIASIAPFVESLSMAKSAAAKVFEVIEEPAKIDPLADRGIRLDECQGHIEFRDVRFDYPNRPDVKILQGLSMEIKKGETVALVGSSGCGKSTCVQLIQRFYDPDDGTILLDGNDLRTINVNWLRSSIGVVGQEPVLFGTSVYENIRYGHDEATQQQIETAAKEANAHNFICKLPHGYHTMVGERGAQMSGGQKQRIAIARALVRNPRILLLDEATSALDTASEAKVQDALDAASHGRTTVIVAHRLSTIRNANNIVVLHHGRVVEQGDHKKLMGLKGHYHALVTVQTGSADDANEENQHTTSFLTSHIVDEDLKPVDVLPEDETDSVIPTISVWQILRWNKPERPYVILGSCCSLIQGSAMPVFSVIYGGIIGTLSDPDSKLVRQETTINCVELVCAGLLVGTATFMQIWSFGIAGEYMTERLRQKTFNAIMAQEMSWHDDKRNGVGTLCALLSGEASSVQGATGQRIGAVLGSITTSVLGIGIGMYYSWRLGFVALIFTPLILIALYMEIRLTAQSNAGNQKALKKSTKIAVEVVSNIRTVVSLGRERMFHQQYLKMLQPSVDSGKRMTHIRGLVFGFARSSLFFANSACIWFGANLVADGNILVGNVFVATQALIMGSVVIASTLAYAPNFQRGIIAASSINALLLREPRVRDPDPKDPSTYDESESGPWNPSGQVSFHDAEFYYPSRPNTTVLHGLNLLVNSGKSVAFVGSSGCGKSTCLQLLLRYYDPTAGHVDMDGRDISTVRMAMLRSQIGIVSQEPSLFDRTIADNIAYGDNSRRVTRADVLEAAKQANIHNFIVGLPLAYETRLGNRGTQLSGGQKQRIAIARALMRRPKVLLLDEATSALDMESEKIVQEALDSASQGRTSITIAHRLSTIVRCDKIYVMHEGQVVESGTHTELLAMKGMYYRLYTLQTGARKKK